MNKKWIWWGILVIVLLCVVFYISSQNTSKPRLSPDDSDTSAQTSPSQDNQEVDAQQALLPKVCCGKNGALDISTCNNQRGGATCNGNDCIWTDSPPGCDSRGYQNPLKVELEDIIASPEE